MTSPSPIHLNVFFGEDSLVQYYDPDCHLPLPLVELPRHLNPYKENGVRIYAKMMTFLPAHNVKSLPALNMLQAPSGLVTKDTSKIVEYSSGSTVISLAILARVLHGINNVHAYLSNKTSRAKLRLMQLFGLEITIFGGPSQPEPTDPRGGIQQAIAQSRDDDSTANPNQYENEMNYRAHMRWTGPQILRQLPQIDVFAAGLGTSGTMTGIGLYLKQEKPTVTRIGVCTAPGDRVPGPRSLSLLDPVDFPWKEAVSHIEEVGSKDSFQLSMDLTRNGIVCGPSSGFNLKGLFNHIERRKQSGTLNELSTRNDGEINCVFLCCDLPFQYVDEYFTHLDQEVFPSIRNENLIGVDKYRYDDRWELEPSVFAEELKDLTSGQPSLPAVLLNLQAIDDFSHAASFISTISLQLRSLKVQQDSPFKDSVVLKEQWLELDDKLPEVCVNLLNQSSKPTVFITDYHGDTARIACSVLRSKGVEAWSLKGGKTGLSMESPLLGVRDVKKPTATTIEVTATAF